MSDAKQKYMAMKMKKIKEEGVRGKAVPHKQAVAIALSYAKKNGM